MTAPASERQPLVRARELASRLAAEGAGVRAVLLYGSHLLNASPDPHSAYDFVVVVDAYGPFYRSLKDAGGIHRPALLFIALAAVLPPNVIAYTPEEGRGGLAKCLVVRSDHLRRALGPQPRDHFLLGRLVQRGAVVWARSEEDRRWLQALLAGARARVLEWMAPFLEGPFTAEELGRRLLAVCYGGELRPEARDRADVIFEAQREHFREALTPGLEEAVRQGTLVRDGDGRYRLAAPVPRGQRRYWRWHFRRSKARVTARWPKHVLTFDNWLPYITRKVERRTGERIELTPRERKWPLVFLWPRALAVLRRRPEREGRVGPDREKGP